VDAFYEQNCVMVVGTYKLTDFDMNTLPPGIIESSTGSRPIDFRIEVSPKYVQVVPQIKGQRWIYLRGLHAQKGSFLI